MPDIISDDTLDSIDNKLKKVIMSQIVMYSIFTLIFFLSVYDYIVIYMTSWIGITILFFYLFMKNRRKNTIRTILYWVGFIFSIIFLVLPINVFAIFLNTILKEPTGIQNTFSSERFWMFYGLLTIFAILSEFIIALYYYIQLRKNTVPFGEGYGYGMWDYFLRETNIKKVIVLILLLLISAVAEEIIFRYIALNFFMGVGIPLFIAITISAFIFGLAHYSNGGWIYTINSTFAGFIFALSFVEMGIIVSWLLHFVWNGLILFQMFIPKLYETTD